MKVLKENKYMNFVDTTAYKGKRFKIKQKLDFNSDLKRRNNNFQCLDLTCVHNPSVSKEFIKGKRFVI